MPWKRNPVRALLGFLLLCAAAPPAAADAPPWLPRYDLDMQLDLDGHMAHVRERVTWTNRHETPAGELVFNAHSHYQMPDRDIGLLAKTLEILRMAPSDAMDPIRTPALGVRQVTLDGQSLPFYYRGDDATALAVPLPRPVGQGEAVTVELAFDFRLPQRQGRWGQWQGVTFLTNWLPVLAVYDNQGWQPTPFIPWHQPFFNEMGLYTARVTLPGPQQIAAGTPVVAVKELGNGLKQVELAPRYLRDFPFLCSARYQEYASQVGPVRVRCVALPEHEHYAREMVRWACEAIPVYERWIGPYPYADFTIVESYFGWNGNQCGGLVMIDERVFALPHLAGPFVEQLISHELCHQWWYNLIGTNGYCETWMEEAMATYFSNRLMDGKHGRNNRLLEYPQGLEWLPNISRDTYRSYGMYGTLGRGEMKPTVQEMQKFGHVVNLFSICYDKGSRIVGLIEARLGEAAFLDFLHVIYARYQYRILRVADFQRELEAYTGRSWEDFFHNWLYGAGMCDWCVEKVTLEPLPDPGPAPPGGSFLAALHGRSTASRHRCKATVLLRQKAEYMEPTVLGICLDGSASYQIRIPIEPQVPRMELAEPPAHIEALANGCMRVEVVLPCEPTQISVDPDQILPDRDPANNHWKPVFRWRFTPLNTPLEETDLTTAYDRWNVIFGPGFFAYAYQDPWYQRSTVIGARASLYRTQEFSGGVYTGYRTDYNDLVAGVDGLWDHWPWPRTQVGFNVERSLTPVYGDDNEHGDRGVLFGRYIFQYGSSLYLLPMHYVELFGTIQDYRLPVPHEEIPGANHFDHQTATGLHYHLDYETPYWDPEGGFRFDMTYTSGLPIFGEHEPFNWVESQFSFVKGLPEQLGPLPLGYLGQTRLAARIYGAAGLPDNGEFFSMGGSELFRGFDLRQRQGNLVWVGSLEWRLPLVQRVSWDCCDHIARVRNLYLAPFYDVGNAYLSDRALGPVAQALGVGLCVDMAWFSFIERTTLRFDIAKAVNCDTPWQFWFGIQHPF